MFPEDAKPRFVIYSKAIDKFVGYGYFSVFLMKASYQTSTYAICKIPKLSY